MTRITVVIEDHAEGIHLGEQLAGGRVVSVQHGDHSELLEVLEMAVRHVDEWMGEAGRSDNSLLPWLAPARTAIAKASA